ncbi:MAG TPA: acetylornithine/succinylornithine family transaminase [Longimicrobiales bacterium]|nr:acetylornithine/succinylornithine family transaminase [Longimicrobiales bacterium]
MSLGELVRTRAATVPETAGSPLVAVYRQPAPVFIGGVGSYLIDDQGERYLDFTSGIGVNALGHGHATIAHAIQRSLDTGLVHTSNLFRTKPATDLAGWLVEHSFADAVFFSNSGAEANEAALKFARRWATAAYGPERTEIVALRGGFHGRTMGALSLTDRVAYQAPFAPLLGATRIAELDADAIAEIVDPARTAAVIIEPIQGEGGVRPVPPKTLRALRDACDRADALLIFDEVQVGLGRTGRLWAHEWSGVTPDVMTLAKPLAGGLPMGATLVTAAVAKSIQPGDHGSTFGGGPLVAGVALAVCRHVAEPAFLADVRTKGARVAQRLEAIVRAGRARDARGSGLLWGLDVATPAADVVARALDAGLLLCSAGPDVVRLGPPLNVADEDLETGLDLLEESL